MRDLITEYNEDALLADGFEDALIGVGIRCGMPYVACYDAGKCIRILMDQGMSEEDAIEYFDFNVTGADVGEAMPIFVYSWVRIRRELIPS